jgi:hypothetical protein
MSHAAERHAAADAAAAAIYAATPSAPPPLYSRRFLIYAADIAPRLRRSHDTPYADFAAFAAMRRRHAFAAATATPGCHAVFSADFAPPCCRHAVTPFFFFSFSFRAAT